MFTRKKIKKREITEKNKVKSFNLKNDKIAIVGASGLVGERLLTLLSDDEKITKPPILFCTERSAGKARYFKGKRIKTRALCEKTLYLNGTIFFVATNEVSAKFIPKAIKQGCFVIDNSPVFRQKRGVPLIVPEINISAYNGQPLVANPNCSTAQAAVALYPIFKEFGLKSVCAVTYQSVSGCGKKGLNELLRARKQNRRLSGSASLTTNLTENSVPQDFAKGLRNCANEHLNPCLNGFFGCDVKNNCIPKIGELLCDGYTLEEKKMQNETRKIFGLNKLSVSAFCVRVPTEFCHGVFLRVNTNRDFSLEKALSALKSFKPIKLILPDDTPYGYPINDLARGNGYVYVGRVRKPQSRVLELYAVADNLLRGAAFNAYEIYKGLNI